VVPGLPVVSLSDYDGSIIIDQQGDDKAELLDAAGNLADLSFGVVARILRVPLQRSARCVFDGQTSDRCQVLTNFV